MNEFGGLLAAPVILPVDLRNPIVLRVPARRVLGDAASSTRVAITGIWRTHFAAADAGIDPIQASWNGSRPILRSDAARGAASICGTRTGTWEDDRGRGRQQSWPPRRPPRSVRTILLPLIAHRESRRYVVESLREVDPRRNPDNHGPATPREGQASYRGSKRSRHLLSCAGGSAPLWDDPDLLRVQAAGTKALRGC